MAEFSKGDRVVKMSGNWAGRYGTVNSVGESGTLNVTFDGERLPKYCDPALCGKVAANAKFKVGDKVRIIGGGVETIASVHPKGRGTGFGPKEVDYYTTRESGGFITDDDIAGVANSRAANAKFKVGDKVVWLHFHSDSLSNETIKDVWKDGTYRVDSGLVSERELYPGHVAKEAEGVTGMRDIGGGRFASPHLPNKWFDLNGRVGANAACNASYRNSHSYFVIAPGIKDHCILSGWDNREDAEYAAADLRKRGVGCSVARRQLLEMSGVDPDVEKSWKGNHVPNAAANAVARNAGESAHFKLFQGMARAAVGEILYAAEGELRALTGKAKECADAARAQGDAKTVSDIARVLSLLKDAVRKHHSDCLRTIG